MLDLDIGLIYSFEFGFFLYIYKIGHSSMNHVFLYNVQFIMSKDKQQYSKMYWLKQHQYSLLTKKSNKTIQLFQTKVSSLNEAIKNPKIFVAPIKRYNHL
jgi:hypothetical protein